jgi:hypothetical protein
MSGSINKIYSDLSETKIFKTYNVLFSDIAPLGTFEKFKYFFMNLALQGILEYDVEVFGEDVNICFPKLSIDQINELVSKIGITRSITLQELFIQVFPIETGGDITGADLYQNRTLLAFAGGKLKKPIRAFIEGALLDSGVKIQKTPQSTFVFPMNWGICELSLFVSQLCETFGISEIPYVDDSSLKHDVLHSTNKAFLSLVKLFDNQSFNISSLNHQSFYKGICGVSKDAFMKSMKELFDLYLKFMFTINGNVATAHPNFNLHVKHFVLAFMKVIGASLEGIQVQGIIKSGPEWIYGGQTMHMVCSSVAIGRDCRKPKCNFLHMNTFNYGIVSTSTGLVFTLCLEETFDNKPTKRSVFNDKLLKNSIITVESQAVAGGCSANPESRAVAGGGSFKPESRAVAGGGSFKPE